MLIDSAQFSHSFELFPTPWTTARQASLSITNSLELAQTHVHSSHLILCHPLLLLPSIFRSIRVFSNESGLHIRMSKYWSFGTSLSNEFSALISSRINWFDLLAVQGIVKGLIKHYSSKASVLQVLSLLYGPTLTSIHDYWKNQSFDSKDLCRQSVVSAF